VLRDWKLAKAWLMDSIDSAQSREGKQDLSGRLHLALSVKRDNLPKPPPQPPPREPFHKRSDEFPGASMPEGHLSTRSTTEEDLAPKEHLVTLGPGIFCPRHRTLPVPKVLTWAISLEGSILPLYTSATEEQP
jgi:hypothetical protein